ncbi:MAG: hypothetical protein ACEQSR_01375 [Candidatus Methylacidiphilales bacterium]
MSQLKNELAEKELIKKFRHEHAWLSRIRAKQNWVSNDVIKIPRQGAAPEVLINNNIYPIVSNDREDDFIVLGLHKYETTNTTVSDDELEALPYEKVNDVQLQHREELEDKSSEHALFVVAPNAHSSATPVLVTTGANDGTGRLRLQTADLITLKKALDKLGVPKTGRLLILCADHVADLLLEDLSFKNSYQNQVDGMISKQFMGFEIWEDMKEVTYKLVGGVMTKEAFGSVATGKAASIIVHTGTTVKATGSAKRYMRAAADDPENRRNSIGFRLYAIAIAIKDEGTAAIVSGTAA